MSNDPKSWIGEIREFAEGSDGGCFVVCLTIVAGSGLLVGLGVLIFKVVEVIVQSKGGIQ